MVAHIWVAPGELTIGVLGGDVRVPYAVQLDVVCEHVGHGIAHDESRVARAHKRLGVRLIA